jgi:hypothetical protein
MTIHVFATVSNGEVYRFAIEEEFRAPSRPSGEGWIFDDQRNIWMNPVTDAYIDYFIARNEQQWKHRRDSRGGLAADTGVTVVSWRRVTQAEWDVLSVDRQYRNALRDRGSKIEHDMPAARECHRKMLRAQRAHAMPELDAQWMKHTGRGDKKSADAIEVRRQKWRDAPADPRIDAAKTVDELKAITW